MTILLRGTLVRASALALGLALAAPAVAHDHKAGAVTVGSPWSRATPPGARTGAGYLTLANEGTEADRLVSASSPAARAVEIHSMSVDGNGVMTMRALPEGVALAPGASATLEPGGLHLMLIGLVEPLREGKSVPVTLAFERSGSVTVELRVEKLGAATRRNDAEGHANH